MAETPINETIDEITATRGEISAAISATRDEINDAIKMTAAEVRLYERLAEVESKVEWLLKQAGR